MDQGDSRREDDDEDRAYRGYQHAQRNQQHTARFRQVDEMRFHQGKRKTEAGERPPERPDLAVEVAVDSMREDDGADDTLDQVDSEMSWTNDSDMQIHYPFRYRVVVARTRIVIVCPGKRKREGRGVGPLCLHE